MSTHYKVTPEFVELIDAMLTAQALYFKMASDTSGKWQPHQKAEQLRICKGLEEQAREWVSLYKQERAKWQAFTDGDLGASAASDEVRSSKAVQVGLPETP